MTARAPEYKADPERIFVAGISTGSLHVATYIFRPELLPPGTARAAGAILLSGPYTFDFSAPTKGELAYFGEDKSRWPKMVVPGNVTRTDIPMRRRFERSCPRARPSGRNRAWRCIWRVDRT